MSEYPKFEKIDQNNIRMIEEKQKVLDVQQIVQAKFQLEGQIKEIKKTLKNIEIILDNAKNLGIDITLKPKDRDVEKKS